MSAIAIFTTEFPPLAGGIGTYTFEMASAASKLGLTPVVFAPFIETAKRVKPAYEVRYFHPAVYRHWHMPLLYWTARRAVRQRRFDAVMAADLKFVVPVALLPASLPKIAIIHGTDAKSRLVRLFNERSPVRPYAAFEILACNSRFTRNLLLTNNPFLNATRAIVTPLGVSDYWRATISTADVSKLTADLRLDEHRSLLVSVGRIERRKGLLQSIEAISRLPQQVRRRLTYLIVGPPIDLDYAAQVKAAAGAADADIRVVGRVAKDVLRAIYQRANLLVHAATADPVGVEGFGLVLLEAAACGLPALVTRVDAIPEVIQDGITGVIVDDRDIDAMTEVIASFVEQPDRARSMSAACKTHAAEFTWERCARATFATVASGRDDVVR